MSTRPTTPESAPVRPVRMGGVRNPVLAALEAELRELAVPADAAAVSERGDRGAGYERRRLSAGDKDAVRFAAAALLQEDSAWQVIEHMTVRGIVSMEFERAAPKAQALPTDGGVAEPPQPVVALAEA